MAPKSINTSDLQSANIAASLPLDNAVNNPEAKILTPTNKNPIENIFSPFKAIGETALFDALTMKSQNGYLTQIAIPIESL